MVSHYESTNVPTWNKKLKKHRDGLRNVMLSEVKQRRRNIL